MMNPIVIGIAGGTGSGKSTFTNRIKAAFPNETSVLYHDNYYRAQDHLSMEERKKTNYDHPAALETELLVEHLRALKRGESVECPVYDYARHTRSQQVTLVTPSPVILLEGILVLSDSELRNQLDIKIFVEADADERILRRIQRDIVERGRDLEDIIRQYLTTVKPMHALYVEPTKALADVDINSGLNDVAFDVISSKIRSVLSMMEK